MVNVRLGSMIFLLKDSRLLLRRQIVGRICARRDLMGHDIRWVKVKAHNGNELNERVDRLAKEARPTPFERVEGEQAELIPL